MKRIEVYQYEDFRPDKSRMTGVGYREIEGNHRVDIIQDDKSGKNLDSLAEGIVFNGYLDFVNQVGQRCQICKILDCPVVRKTEGLGEVEFDDLVAKVATSYFKKQ